MIATIVIRVPHPDHPAHALAQANVAIEVQDELRGPDLLRAALALVPPIDDWQGVRSTGG